jgi:predicted amidohydrolase
MIKKKVITVDLLTFDPGPRSSSPALYANEIVERVCCAWDSGADLVLLPEFTWMGLEPLIVGNGKEPLKTLAKVFWNQLFPEIQQQLSRAQKAVVLGTVPALTESGAIRNRAPILSNGTFFYQEKLHLTPWEDSFEPGDSLKIWTFGNFRIAVIICLDIEIPELSARLRNAKVDLVLCPSATETILGVERVNRCASARAVELGCYVGVSHLTGTADSALIDCSLGCAALYSPSQSAFGDTIRCAETPIYESGNEALRVSIDKNLLDASRRMRAETNPANLGQKAAGIDRFIRIESNFLT